MAKSSRVEFSRDSLSPNLKRLPMRVDMKVHEVLRYHSPGLRNYAKSNAPWTDRTGNARTGLSTRTGYEGPSIHVLALYHRVPYGIWLEIRFQGQFSIIMPAINYYGPVVMASLHKLLAHLGGEKG